MAKLALRKRESRAFTLVELLVVIGIIAVLISILLPALGKSREKANQVKCTAQIRQILQGMILHANEHRGYMPLAGQINVSPNGGFLLADTQKTVEDSKGLKYEYYGGYTSPDPTDPFHTHITSTAAGIGKYLGQGMDFTDINSIQKSMDSGVTRKIMVCPSDKDGGRFGHTVQAGGAHWSSYAFNESALGWWTAANPGMRANTARFPHAARLMLLADAAPRGDKFIDENPDSWMLWNDGGPDCTLGDWYRDYLGKSNKGAGDPRLMDMNRHRGRMMVGCADGHVDNLLISEGDLDKISLNLDMDRR